ncbi:MAG: hypothetical protein AB7U98_05750 [Candidatus Nitrosocosmicus sp.]|mgnify:CR=1 FL=1|jgi:hypothetical protein|uniref:hypothetical protein n=1 Tax=Candidatus Nitrosocosmicus sp. FF01 TaxID=3397670 RepID=UPI0039ECFC40
MRSLHNTRSPNNDSDFNLTTIIIVLLSLQILRIRFLSTIAGQTPNRKCTSDSGIIISKQNCFSTSPIPPTYDASNAHTFTLSRK